MKRKKLSLLIASLFTSTTCLAVEMNGVPPNIQNTLNELGNNDPNLNFRYGQDGSVTVEQPGNSQRYYPLLTDPNIDQSGIPGDFQINPDGSATFGDGSNGMMYVPTQQEGLSYPSFPDGFTPPSGSEIPSNVSLPPGFVPPENTTVNTDNIPPMNASSFLENQGITDFQQGSDGTITYNGQQYQPFFGFTGEVGVPQAGANPEVKIGDDGTVTFPDGSMYFPVGGEGQPSGGSSNQGFPSDFQPTQNSDGTFTIPGSQLPEGIPLPSGATQNSDGSVTVPQPPDFKDEFPGNDPQFLGASQNSDGTFTLPDGSIVQAPPIIDDGFSIDPSTGKPQDKDGTDLSLDPTTGLPIDPTSGQPFIPGQLNSGSSGGGSSPDNIQIDPSTGFPIDPSTGQPFDPLTGQGFDSTNGFQPPPPDDALPPPDNSGGSGGSGGDQPPPDGSGGSGGSGGGQPPPDGSGGSGGDGGQPPPDGSGGNGGSGGDQPPPDGSGGSGGSGGGQPPPDDSGGSGGSGGDGGQPPPDGGGSGGSGGGQPPPDGGGSGG